jgi:hypothetical protein
LTSKRTPETLTFSHLSAMPDLCICDSVLTFFSLWEYFTVQNPWLAVGALSSICRSKHAAVSPLWIQVGQPLFTFQCVEKSKNQAPLYATATDNDRAQKT